MSSRIIPTLRYADAKAAIEWLSACFGFESRLEVPNEDGSVAHAELVLGDGMVMIGQAHDGHLEQTLARPGEPVTASAYLILDDPDACFAKAMERGAAAIMAPQDMSYGGRGFSLRDPWGQVWHGGSYDPWA
jgi:uncharacterized glyoxalase superfamily protein PhnB